MVNSNRVKKIDKKIRVIGVIPARWGSTRLPGKPLAMIKGKSMIRRVYEQCLKAEMLDEVIVATDDVRIMREVEGFGGRAVMTSKKCRNGTERVQQIANNKEQIGNNKEQIGNNKEQIANNKEQIANKKYLFDGDIFVNVQGDEPFIPPENIDLLVRKMLEKKVDIATMAIRFKDEEEAKDVNKVKVVFDKDGMALYFSRSVIPFNREKEKKINYFKHIGIYAYTRKFLMEFGKMKRSKLEEAEMLEQLRFLENGYGILVVETRKDSISIDTPKDLIEL